MTDCFITNATWAADGSLVDLIISKDNATTTLLKVGDEEVLVAAQVAPAGQLQAPAGMPQIDATGQILLPGLVDLHAKVSQSGKSASKAIQLAQAAAKKGGVCTLLAMPSKAQSFDNHATLDSFYDAVSKSDSCKMIAAGCITHSCEGEQQAPYNTLAARGVKIFTDADHVPSNLLMLHRAMQYVADLGLTFAIRPDLPSLSVDCVMHHCSSSYSLGMRGVPACAEEIGLETLLRLAKDSQVKLHLQGISTGESVDIIRRHQSTATAEVALHNLLFTHKDIGDYNTTFKTLPPLREEEDTQALIEGLKDGSIDCIVSDHYPCSAFAKKQEFPSAPYGMLGLDTYLPALYTHLVKRDKLTWQELLRVCCTKPASILFGEQAPAMPLILFKPDVCTQIEAEQLPSGTLNSPFLGQQLWGEVSLLNS